MRLRVAGRRRLERRSSGARARRRRWWPSRSPTPASASRRRSRRSSSRPSSRRTPAPAASTAARAWAWPSAASWRTCWAARSSLRSTPGKGSTFTLYLPMSYAGPTVRRRRRRGGARRRRSARRRCRLARADRAEHCPTTATQLGPGDTVLLIVEDDPHYARVLVDLARDKGFKVLVAIARRRGAALCAAIPARPPSRSTSSCPTCWAGPCSASSSDPADAPHPGADPDARRGSPARSGARRILLRHQADDARKASSAALARIKDYAEPRRKRLLVVEDNAGRAARASRSCSATTTSTSSPPTPARQRSGHAAQQPCDCVVLDLRLPDMTRLRGAGTHPRRPALRDLPVVVFTGSELSPEEDPAAYAGPQRGGQGCGVARTAARRDGAVPAPGRSRTYRAKSSRCSSGCMVPTRI